MQKPNLRITNVTLFAVGALCLLLPVYVIVQGGVPYYFPIMTLLESKPLAALFFLAPCLGLLAALLPIFKRAVVQSLVLSLICALGIVILLVAKPFVFEYGSRFATLSWGGYASVFVYAVGIVVNLFTQLLHPKHG